MSRTVTLIVHGTFAREGKWWRLGDAEETTFADRLEDGLAQRGLSGTVWKPALAEGFDYASFAWSGENRHRDRLKGARELASSVNKLAQHIAATPSDPLTVNFVAHSHGGNVVLEALRHLDSNARAGRIALLGTPLVTVRPALRIMRFFLAAILLALFFLSLMVLFIQLGALLTSGELLDSLPTVGENGQPTLPGMTGEEIVAWLVPMLLGYAWAFWLVGNVVDLAWRGICFVFLPIQWLRGKSSLLVYGPSLRKLATILDGQSIILLTSRNDEADIVLRVGSEPARLYQEYVAEKFSKTGRLLEFIFLRPFVLGAFLKATEMVTEIVSLGFSRWGALFFDYEVAPADEQPYYDPQILIHQKIDVRPRTDSSSPSNSADTSQSAMLRDAAEPGRGLHISLWEVANEIKRQINLRHSAYYEDQAVIDRVSEFLTGGEAQSVGQK